MIDLALQAQNELHYKHDSWKWGNITFDREVSHPRYNQLQFFKSCPDTAEFNCYQCQSMIRLLRTPSLKYMYSPFIFFFILLYSLYLVFIYILSVISYVNTQFSLRAAMYCLLNYLSIYLSMQCSLLLYSLVVFWGYWSLAFSGKTGEKGD